MSTRRSFLALTAGSLAAVGLTACGAGEDSPGADGSPRTGGTLTFSTDVEPDVYDPHVSPADIVGVLLRNVFDSLVAQDAKGGFHPWLARSWEISEDGREYTFVLRDDVRFTDGTRFDAAAVKANFDHIVAPATKSQYAAVLIGPYEGTEVVDEFTAKVRLKRPYAPFLRAASTTYLGFHSPEALRDHPDKLAGGAEHSVGTGPFTFAQRVKGQKVVFEKNPDYRWPPATAETEGAPRLDRLVVTFLPENATRIGAVTSGQADIADFVPPARLAGLEKQSGLTVVGKDSPGIVYQDYLNTARAPFDQREARLAVQHAVDTAAITKAVFAGRYERAWSALSPSTPGYDATLKRTWGHDPKKAAALLDGLGWTGRDDAGYRTRDGRRFSIRLLYVPAYTKAERRTYDTAVQDALKQVGIELKLVPMDAGSYTPVRNRGEYDLIAFAWGGSDPDLLRTVFHSDSALADGGANGSRIADDRIDGWLDEAVATTDPAERHELYARVQRRAIGEGYALPAFVGTRHLAVRDRVRGVAFDASAWPLFHDAWVASA